MSAEPYISLTSWAGPRDKVGTLHVVIPHGKGTRAIAIEVTLEQCLALCANAADAARLLAQEASRAV